MPTLAGYEIEQALGQGAMGAVLLGRQTAVGRQVALKQVLNGLEDDGEARARFQQEARTLAKLNHPGIVHIFDLATSADGSFMVMEYVPGPTLRQVLTRRRVTESQALRVVADLAAALDYASSKGVTHRDLKPANVFITPDGTCKLGDFGLAKLQRETALFQTQVGTILGTPTYMSPEQAAGSAKVDARSDVYSLGVIAYEMLVGRPPFEVGTEGMMALLEAHISAPPPAPSDVAPGFPKDVERVLLKALAKEPKQRYASAGEFARALHAAADSAWPGWPGGTDLSLLAEAPESGADVDPSMMTVVAATDATRVRIGRSPEKTMARGRRGPAADDTVVAPAAGDETVIASARPDDTIVARPADTTVVARPQAAAAPPPDATVAVPAAEGTIAFAPAATMAQRAKQPVYDPGAGRSANRLRVVLLVVLVVLLVAVIYLKVVAHA